MSFKYYLCGSNKNEVYILSRKLFYRVFGIVVTFSFLVPFVSVFSQYTHDIGIGVGSSGYTGDISRHFISTSETAYTGFYRYNFTSRLALKGELDYGHVNASTDGYGNKYPISPSDSVTSPIDLDYSFRTKHISTDVMFEVNFLPYPKQVALMRSSDITPFANIGIGAVVYNVEDMWSSAFSIPMGVGVRWLFADQWGMQMQFKAKRLFTDSFDGAQLDDPIDLGGSLANDDWLYMTTFSLTYSFGQNLWDCNCPKDSKRRK